MIAILVLLNAAKSMLLSQPSIKSPEHCEQRFPNCFKTPPRPSTEDFSPRTTKTVFQKAGSKNPSIPKKKRLTRAQLATSCLLWTGHVDKIERGYHNMTLLTLIRIASRLGKFQLGLLLFHHHQPVMA